MNILSPTSGIVERVEAKSVYIYIAPEDDHGIYAPIAGKLSYNYEEGTFFPPKFFTIKEPKTGRLFMTIQNVSFYVEVGKPQYITNTVRIEKEGIVAAGEKVGEILIGSRSWINAPEGYRVVVEEGLQVVGGRSVLFEPTILGIAKNSISSSGGWARDGRG